MRSRRASILILFIGQACAAGMPRVHGGSWHWKWFGQVGVTVGKVAVVEGRLSGLPDDVPGDPTSFRPTRIEVRGKQAQIDWGSVSEDGRFRGNVGELVWVFDLSPGRRFKARVLFENDEGSSFWSSGSFSCSGDDRTELDVGP